MAGGRAGAASSLLSGEVVLPVAGRERCGRAWGGVGVSRVGWWPVSVVSEGRVGAGCVWSCSTSKRALSSGGEEGMWAV